MNEFYKLVYPKMPLATKLIAFLSAFATFSLFIIRAYEPINPECFLVLVFPIVALFISELYVKSTKPFENIAITLLGIVYLTIPFSLTSVLVFDAGNYDFRLLLSLFIFIWANDVGAYCFGSTLGRLGKHKLFERISPKKSWEGFFGGVLMALLAAFILSSMWAERTGILEYHWYIIAVIIAVVGTFGDLAESMLKRSVGVKDSGNLMPGHGGILDRFDGVLLSFPCAVAYIILINL